MILILRKVALTKQTTDKTSYAYFCGGVLIDVETVLTGEDGFLNLFKSFQIICL